jgi:hypothetical protein
MNEEKPGLTYPALSEELAKHEFTASSSGRWLLFV